MPIPLCRFIRRFLGRDDGRAPSPALGRGEVNPVSPMETPQGRVTASFSDRPVPFAERQRLRRYHEYLREHGIPEPSRHDAQR